MTDEQFNALATYEDNFRTAINTRWARHPGRTALATINSIYSAAAGVPPRRVNFLCQQCVLDLLRSAGKLYFAEKDRREAMAQTERQARDAEAAEKLRAAQEAEKPATAAKKPRAKKTPAKPRKAAETEK